MEYNVMTAFVAVVMTLMVAVGYVPLLLFPLQRWARWICWGVIMIMVIGALRQGYWDFLQYLAGDNWQALRTYLGGQKFSTVFNVGTILSCWIFLRARVYLVPKRDRAGWYWWNVWMHPCDRCRFGRKQK